MRNLIIILLTNLILFGCANAPFTRELEVRSGYGEETPEPDLFSKRVFKEKESTEVYVFPQELPNGDLYRGGYVDAVIYEKEWVKEKPQKVEYEKTETKEIEVKNEVANRPHRYQPMFPNIDRGRL